MLEIIDQISWELATQHPYFLPLSFGMMGLCIGSYLNVVIYRLPLGLSTGKPKRSFCPLCRKDIAGYDNIPVLSWLLLRGRSRCCQQPISARYICIEVLTGLLFALFAFLFADENIITQALICGWIALSIAIFWIDLEKMIVLPRLCVMASVLGLLCALSAPHLISMGSSFIPLDGLILSIIGMASGFILLKLVAFLGKIFLGKKSKKYPEAVAWSICSSEDGQDIILRIEQEEKRWSEIFMEPNDQIELLQASLILEKPALEPCSGPALIRFYHDNILLPDGVKISLDAHEGARGNCLGWRIQRAAMGSGDAWIAMGIGALCGWEAVLFSLVGGSFIGIIWSIIARIGRGKPIPFGPCMLGAALLYLLYGTEWIWSYTEWLSSFYVQVQ